jgi:hypothetical protein
MTRRWCLFLITSTLAHGALNGPTSGRIFDPVMRAIRPILGVPGAAYLGSPQVTGLDFADISPDGTVAVARKGSSAFVISGFDTGHLIWAKPQNIDPDFTGIAWNANSSAAVAYAASGHVQVLRGPWVAPRADDPADVHVSSGQLAFALIDVQAGNLIVGVQDVSAGGLYRFMPHSAPVLLASIPCPAAGMLLEPQDELFVVDCAGTTLTRIGAYKSQAVVSAIHLDSGHSDHAVAMALSQDARSLFMAKTSGVIAIHDVQTGRTIESIAVGSKPAFLRRLPADGVFQVTSRNAAAAPLFLLATQPTPRVVFVPTGFGESHGQ